MDRQSYPVEHIRDNGFEEVDAGITGLPVVIPMKKKAAWAVPSSAL